MICFNYNRGEDPRSLQSFPSRFLIVIQSCLSSLDNLLSFPMCSFLLSCRILLSFLLLRLSKTSSEYFSKHSRSKRWDELLETINAGGLWSLLTNRLVVDSCWLGGFAVKYIRTPSRNRKETCLTGEVTGDVNFTNKDTMSNPSGGRGRRFREETGIDV